MIEPGKLEEFTQNLKLYVDTNFELLKLKAVERTSVVGSGLISGIIISVVALLSLLFLSTGIGFYISNLTGNYSYGFGIVAGFYLLLTLILIIGRKSIIEKPMRNKIIEKMLDENVIQLTP